MRSEPFRVFITVLTVCVVSACQLLPVEQPDRPARVETRTVTVQAEAAATAQGPGCDCAASSASFMLATVEEIKEIQARLILLGYPAGQIDGVVGHQTRHAIKAYQADHRLLTDGRPSTELLLHIRQVAGNGSTPAN